MREVDLVEALRDHECRFTSVDDGVCYECLAIDEIERLREALGKIRIAARCSPHESAESIIQVVDEIARAAIEGGKTK